MLTQNPISRIINFYRRFFLRRTSSHPHNRWDHNTYSQRFFSRNSWDFWDQHQTSMNSSQSNLVDEFHAFPDDFFLVLRRLFLLYIVNSSENGKQLFYLLIKLNSGYRQLALCFEMSSILKNSILKRQPTTMFELWKWFLILFFFYFRSIKINLPEFWSTCAKITVPKKRLDNFILRLYDLWEHNNWFK